MWFKVDDKLHDHRKTRKAGKAAMGVWVLAGSWAMDHETDGFIPDDVLTRWGSPADARRLVDAGLWREATQKGEQGWKFHDWARFQPSAAVTAAKKAAEQEAGLRGNHKRWHETRGITDPDCEYCYRVPDREPDQVPDRVEIGAPESPPNRPVPEPEPVPDEGTDVPSRRDDVERLCQHLLARVRANGAKRARVTEAWRTSARLMLDRDGYTEQQVTWLIDKATGDEFWRANILSMPKLRDKADQLRLKFGASATPQLTRLPRPDELEIPPSGMSVAEYAEWERERVERRRSNA